MDSIDRIHEEQEELNEMKLIEELGAQAIKRRLKAIYALPQGTLTQAQRDGDRRLTITGCLLILASR